MPVFPLAAPDIHRSARLKNLLNINQIELFNVYWSNSRNSLTHFENLTENAAGFLKYVSPFLNVSHKRVYL